MDLLKSLCSFVSWLVGVYSTLIVIRVIVSWILSFSRRSGWRSGYGGYGYHQEPQNESVLETVDRILGKITDPYLDLFGNVSSLRRGNMDFTPLLALVLLDLVQSIFNVIAQAGSITIWLVLAIVVQGLWTLVSFIMVIMLILMVVRLAAGRGNSYQGSSLIDFIDPIIDAPVEKVYRAFFRKRGNVEDQKLVLTSLIVYFVLYLVLKGLESWLVSYLIAL